VHSGASVGVALYPDDGDDGGALLQQADTAMYAAKRQGRGNFQFFSPAMNAATHEHLLLENRMWSALEREGFDLHLQAQVSLDTGRVIGAEVLLRWHDPELGSVEPSRFIPIAEESGLILPLGDWVLSRTMQLLAEWQHSGLRSLRLAVNLSARQFTGEALLARLDQLTAQHRIDPSRLELEITETAAMRDPPAARARLQTRDRRLRHRLLVAVLPEAVRHRPHQDRPRLRAGHRDQPERRGDRRGHHRAGPLARADGGGGRRGDGGAVGLPAREARRRGAGLFVRAADAGARVLRLRHDPSAASTWLLSALMSEVSSGGTPSGAPCVRSP
jgi:hypothetical protein